LDFGSGRSELVEAERAGAGASAPVRPARVLQPGRNCWTIASAPKASVLIDAKAYFDELARALRKAEKSIMIIGWDFDGRIRLCPDCDDCTETLGDLLRAQVEAKSELEVRVLVWSVAVAHAPGASLPLLIGADWDNHPRIHVRLDTEHPIYAAHHQKIVCIDDAIAFAGGMDLTVERWDTPDHLSEHPCRLIPEGSAYGPVHDLQMMVNGEAARHLATLARDRWRRAIGELLPPVEADEVRWLDENRPDFRDVEVGIARTSPPWHDEPEVEEVANLTADMLRAARRSIYIEAQYLACNEVASILGERLEEPDGPEIVAVVACSSHGLMERLVMGNNRDRVIRTLRQHDRYGRLRAMYPAIGEGEKLCEILVHAKVMIIDDTLLRVGSANLNNRSRGLDTECDLVIEAKNAATRQTITSIRNRLLAEHLGVDEGTVARWLDQEGGSLIACVDKHNDNGPRGLHTFDAMQCDGDGPCEPVFGTAIFDPARPISLV
jgi:phosphatidylserine/phosphatidylglycerophosphate/cardiolipin synthase-like enzyme